MDPARMFKESLTSRPELENSQGQKQTSAYARVMSALSLPAQPVDATQALNLSAGVSNCKVSRGRSLS